MPQRKDNPPLASPHVESNPDHLVSVRRHSNHSCPNGAGGCVTRTTLNWGTLPWGTLPWGTLTSAGGG